jgi:high affinity sulfate transporter 1
VNEAFTTRRSPERLPGLRTLLAYERAWLGHDLLAGLALTAVLVPVGIAYAVASGLPAVCGLYATIFPLLAYALFGPSRVLVIGPDSSLTVLTLAVVLALAGGSAERAIAVAGAMAIVAGLVCIAAGWFRLGFVTELLSKPIRHGYMNGIAIAVIASQLPALLGVRIEGADGFVAQMVALAHGVFVEGRTSFVALAVGGASLAVVLGLRRVAPQVPGVLVAVVGATLAVALFGLAERHDLAVVGALPQGLPTFALPRIQASDLAQVVLGGVAVALVAFADTSVLSRTYAARRQASVDPNQEMVALGAANVAGGLFGGMPVSASASRTPVAEAAGARTQLTGVVGAAGVAVVVVFAPALLANLPTAALAAVVIASALGLIEIADVRRIWRIQRWEAWLSIVCTIGVVVFGAIPGIGFAVVIAVIEFLWDGWRPHAAILGRVDGLKGYHDVTRYPHARHVPGLVLFRWDAPLFFANAELFHDRVLAAVATAPSPVRRVVVAAEPVTSIDVTAADMLAALDDRLRAAGIDLHFAELKDPVRDKIRRFELSTRFDGSHFHPTLGEAVAAHVAAERIVWTDWEDAPAAPSDATAGRDDEPPRGS